MLLHVPTSFAPFALIFIKMLLVTICTNCTTSYTKGLFGLRGEGRRVEGSSIELAENMLISDSIYFTLLYSSSHPLNPNEP